jgi:hypothetical protein
VQWLLDARLLRDHGPVCTAAVWDVLLYAAPRLASLLPAGRGLSAAPAPQAAFQPYRQLHVQRSAWAELRKASG